MQQYQTQVRHSDRNES